MAACAIGRTQTLREHPWPQATLWLAVLAPFFFLSYGLADWITSQRHNVPSLVFGWERHMPFLAWTIVPYWSIDLLYGVSLFICRTREELTVHGKRLLAAQVISVSAFLLFPLRFSFERPPIGGFLGEMFDALASFDRPFNQAPSLHLSIAAILWARYSRHLMGLALWLIRIWVILAGLSTMTTYQHHFIDVVTGVWVGLLCIAFFHDDEASFRRSDFRDREGIRISLIYLAGFSALIVLAIRIGGAAWWLLWPAGSLLIVAVIYFIGQPEMFCKQGGAIAPAMLWLLAPYLGAAWLNSRVWTHKIAMAQEISDGVWLGRLPRKSEREAFASIVDLTAELPIQTTGVSYRAVPMLDLLTPSLEQLDAAEKAVEELDSKRPTLVCCALGYSRSAAVVAAWLRATGRARSVHESIALIKERRPEIALSPSQRERIEEWCNAHVRCSQ